MIAQKSLTKIFNEFSNSNALFLAVLPAYRTECIEILMQTSTGETVIFVSAAHLDPSVKTGIPEKYYTMVPIIRLFGRRAFIQIPTSLKPLLAKSLVLDLNPRSLTVWVLLVLRRILNKRTLLWGHVNPQRGATARTAAIRRTMRRLSNGTICYTYSDRAAALKSLPSKSVWVAPNSLYKADLIKTGSSDTNRTNVLYVGRFEPAKKVDLLVRAFAQAKLTNAHLALTLVGGGSEESGLRRLAGSLGIEDSVEFAGWVDDRKSLERHYDRAFCSTSPGFAGLGLTQSLGFGVPVVVSDKEPHSPEIELADTGGVYWFSANSVSDLSSALLERWDRREEVPSSQLSDHVRLLYSAESMAQGLNDALENVRTT